MLFVVLVGVYVLGRLVFTIAVASAPECADLEPILIGESGKFDAVLDTILLTGLAGFGVLTALLINSIASKRTHPVDMVMAAVNFCMVGLLVATWAVTWAFFNPWHPAAGPMNRAFQEHVFLSLGVLDPRVNAPSGKDWVRVDESSFVNEAIGVFARYEKVKICWPAEFRRRHLELRYGGGILPDGNAIADLSDDFLEQPDLRFVFYDLNGNYITSEFPFDHDNVRYLKNADIERNERRANVDYFAIWDAVRESWYPEPEELRPFTREEINAMVAETWDREAPLE